MNPPLCSYCMKSHNCFDPVVCLLEHFGHNITFWQWSQVILCKAKFVLVINFHWDRLHVFWPPISSDTWQIPIDLEGNFHQNHLHDFLTVYLSKGSRVEPVKKNMKLVSDNVAYQEKLALVKHAMDLEKDWCIKVSVRQAEKPSGSGLKPGLDTTLTHWNRIVC